MEENGLAACRFGILTVSDSRTSEDDESGPAIETFLQERFNAVQIEAQIVSDDLEKVRDALLEMSSRCDVVITTGGTGFGPRDNTPEATAQVIEKRADSISEKIRLDGLSKTPLAHLSRGIAGIRGQTLIVNLPGSPAGAREGVEALAPLLPHIVRMMSGDTAH